MVIAKTTAQEIVDHASQLGEQLPVSDSLPACALTICYYRLILMTFWLAQYVTGFISPALEPSTLGKRNYCYIETLVYALPVIVAGLFLIRRLYPLSPIRTAMSVGLVAGMLPALYMQLACMYEPAHILTFHILPGLLMVGAGAGIAMKWSLRQRSSDPQ